MPAKASTKKPDPRERQESLVEFSSLVDAQLGSRVGLAVTVVDLHTAKDVLGQLEARRKAIYDMLVNSYARGARGDRNWYLREVDVPAVVRTPAVPSEIAKTHDKALWEAAKTRTPWVSAKAPAGWGGGPRPKMPPTPKPYASSGELAAAYKHHAFERIATLRTQIEDLKERLRSIAERTASTGLWDGTEARLSDGWAVSTVRLQYDSERLAVVAPEVFATLALPRITPATRRITVMPMAKAVAAGYVEPGEIETAD